MSDYLYRPPFPMEKLTAMWDAVNKTAKELNIDFLADKIFLIDRSTGSATTWHCYSIRGPDER